MPMTRFARSALGACVAFTGAALCPLAAGDQPAAQERGTKVVPGRPARVFVMAGFDQACKSLKPVKIELVQRPAKGKIDLRDGQETTIQYSASGTCIGTRQSGTGIYYVAADGATGTDTFTVSAQLGGGAPVTRTFTVVIADD